ncbi:hypothetical protein PR048_021629 [Dryococelus australis]|uniref:Zinc finger PHD-type domain-containing protein n=1 Tax=Dryococelus australis TaxID=614101 RepID=A0ABQ9GYW4_9NEOP|nr:hypothetical protein PR048_021629 [Dryococelus australis]
MEVTDNSSAWNSDKLSEDNDAQNQQVNVSFMEILTTPARNAQPAKRNRPAINSRAVQVQKLLLQNSNTDSIPCSSKNVRLSMSTSATNQKHSSKKSINLNNEESWYCYLCQEEKMVDMRACSLCNRYVYEDCVGFTKHDKQVFQCPTCEV